MEAELAKALVQFRGKVQPIAFDSANPHFKNRFASLAAIHKAIDPLLAECGLTIMQIPTNPAEGQGIGIHTIVIHTSGQCCESTFIIPTVKNDPQGVGSSLTYGRRYALSGILGLVTEEDEDGNAASAGADAISKAGKPKKPRAKPTPAMSAANRKALKESIEARILLVGTPDNTIDEVLAFVTKALGYASKIEILDADLDKAGDALVAWMPVEPAEGGE